MRLKSTSANTKKWWNKIPNPIAIGGTLSLIVIIASLLRFYDIGKLSFWQDELFTTGFIKVSLKDIIPIIWQKQINMSFYYLLVNLWAKLLPNISEGSLRLLSAIFSIASIPVVFLLGKSLATNKQKAAIVGLVAALLVAFNAYSIQYAQELRSYSLVFLLTALSTLLFIKAIEKHSPIWWIGYSIISAAALYCHFFAAFILIAQVISLLFLFRKNVHTFPFKGIISSFVAILILATPLIVAVHLEPAESIGWIPRLSSAAIENFLIDITGNQGGLLVALYVYTAMAGFIIEAIRVSRQKEIFIKWKLILITCCLFLPVTMALLVSLIKPIFVDRYLIFVMPYLTIFAAEGIASLISVDKWKNRNFIGAILLFLFILISAVGVKNYFDTSKKEDYRGVAQFMSNHCVDSLVLYYPQWIGSYVPYYNDSLKSQTSWWYGLLNENPTPKNLLTHLPSTYTKACLMLGALSPETAEQKYQIHLIQETLQGKYPKVSKVNFYRLEVDIFQL